MKSGKTIRIVIADDHKIFREGLGVMLTRQKDLKVIGQAENGLQLIDLIKKSQPDVVLTDIRMPVMDGIQATQWIVRHYPRIQVVALTIFSDRELTDKMFESGASDFLLKNAEPAEVYTVIRRVAGKTGIPGIVSSKLVRFVRNRFLFRKKEKQLTEKQVEIIRLICTEHTTREISEKLSLSERTVEEHRRNIQKLTGARNVVGIVLYAIRKGIITLEDEAAFQRVV